MTKSVGNRDLIRAINRSRILNVIKSDGPIGRADIARASGLSPATVTGITSDLIDDQLIEEVSLGDSSGGRPQILLALNPKGGYIIGIKLMEDHLICALTDLEATIVSQIQTDLESQKPDSVVTVISRVVADIMRSEKISATKLLGVGVGLAGVVHHEEGVVRYSPFFGWRNYPLGPKIREALGVPVYIDNDVNTFAIAESLFGSAQNEPDFFTVTVGRGIGLGVMSRGIPFRGAAGGAGELGHTTIDLDGPLCSCGKKGCLEMFVSEPALLTLANADLDLKVGSINDLVKLADSGDQTAQKIFQEAGELLGRKVAELIMIMGPRLVIVSGEGIRMGDYFFKPMLDAIDHNVMPAIAGTYEVRIEPWGDDAWARGAACLVLNQIFHIPSI